MFYHTVGLSNILWINFFFYGNKVLKFVFCFYVYFVVSLCYHCRAMSLDKYKKNVDILTEKKHRLLDIMNFVDLNNCIKSPTRYGPTRQSLLDLILVKECSIVNSEVYLYIANP